MLPTPPAIMDESDRKLYTLLALRELGSCTHMQLLHFMFENDIMTYFDLSLALHELVKEEHAVKVPHPADNLYLITEAGREALSFFVNRLSHSKVKLIYEKAPVWREKFSREKQFVGKLNQNERGEYIAKLTLMDGDSPLLDISIPVPERALADRMVKAWPSCAGTIYQQLMKTLEEAPEEA